MALATLGFAILLVVYLIMNLVTRNLFGLGAYWQQVEIVLGVLLVVDLAWFARTFKRNSDEFDAGIAERKARKERLRSSGKEAPAVITSVGEGGFSATGGGIRKIGAVVGLDVQPALSSPFSMTLRMVISELQIPQYQPGKKVTVRYMPDDPENGEIVGFVND
jgi:hypothetical protein